MLHTVCVVLFLPISSLDSILGIKVVFFLFLFYSLYQTKTYYFQVKSPYLQSDEHGQKLSLVSDQHAVGHTRQALFDIVLYWNGGNILSPCSDDQLYKINVIKYSLSNTWILFGADIHCIYNIVLTGIHVSHYQKHGNTYCQSLILSNLLVVSADWFLPMVCLPFFRPVTYRNPSLSFFPMSPDIR